MDIEGFHTTLDEAADQIPEELLRNLNGGIIVLPDIKMHPRDAARNLYIMGEYHVQIPGLGRYITLYYGSFERVFGVSTPNEDAVLREEIRKTLVHELRHHIESLSGVRDLEYEDELRIESYYLRQKNYRYDD